jgi:hypothetical protein
MCWAVYFFLLASAFDTVVPEFFFVALFAGYSYTGLFLSVVTFLLGISHGVGLGRTLSFMFMED